METLYPPNDEGNAPGDGDDAVLSQELKNSFDAVQSLLASSSHKEAQSMATKTAVQATEEITRLQNGIAELEALLQQQEEQQQNDDNVLPVPVVAFPALPPVVIEEEEDEEDVEQTSSNHNQGKGEQLVSS